MFEDLFEVFQKTDSNSEIAMLCQKYPQYHKGYICIGADSSCVDTKKWLESLWRQYAPYADKAFLSEFKRQLFQRLWELYLGATLLNRGYKLGEHKDEGADLEVTRVNQPSVWIEAIAINNGKGMNKVPDISEGHFMDVPTDQILLRLTAALKAKHDKYLIDLANGRIKPNEPYVIALDRSGIGYHVDTFMPNIIKVLFGVGNPAVERRVDGNASNKESKITWLPRLTINNQNGKEVSSLFFENPLHEGVSAVIYSKDQVVDCPRSLHEMGENCVIIHNPFAKNPLPDSFFVFGDEYRAIDDKIKRIRDRKAYLRPNIYLNQH